jgi:hypothetical protein
MSKTGSMLLKCFGISAAAGAGTCAMFYGLFVSHQELGVEPAVAYRFAVLAFLLTAIVSLVYFRMKAAR